MVFLIEVATYDSESLTLENYSLRQLLQNLISCFTGGSRVRLFCVPIGYSQFDPLLLDSHCTGLQSSSLPSLNAPVIRECTGCSIGENSNPSCLASYTPRRRGKWLRWRAWDVFPLVMQKLKFITESLDSFTREVRFTQCPCGWDSMVGCLLEHWSLMEGSRGVGYAKSWIGPRMGGFSYTCNHHEDECKQKMTKSIPTSACGLG